MKEMIGITQYDKLLHFLVNCFIVIVIGIFSIPIALAVSLLCSFGKEIYDQIKYKGFDWWDILADLLGALFGLLVCL